MLFKKKPQGRIQDFFYEECNTTSTPINHIVFFFWQNTSCIRKPQVISGGWGGGGCLVGVSTTCTLSLDPPRPEPSASRRRFLIWIFLILLGMNICFCRAGVNLKLYSVIIFLCLFRRRTKLPFKLKIEKH